MESNQTGIEKFFGTIGGAIKNFVLTIWNGFIGLLEKIFPHEFSIMIAIVILIIIFFALFRAFVTKQ